MCLTIKEGGFKMVAEEDMTVYKVINIRDNTSAVWRFYYEPGARYTLSPADSDKFSQASRYVGVGFHAYTTKKAMADVFREYQHQKTVAFTIPKGAHYYLGFYEEIVSDQIIAGNLEAL